MSVAHRVESEPWIERLYLPSYLQTDVARYVGVPRHTVARWRNLFGLSHGRASRQARPTPLSFADLITIAFIAALRRNGIDLDDARWIHDNLRGALEDDYPFMLLAFKTRAPLLLGQSGVGGAARLGIVAQQGHYAWAAPILAEFERFDYEHDLALRWYPRGRDSAIVIDARIAFGGPTIDGAGILTYILKQRFLAGEAPEETAEDFGISLGQLEEALRFESVHSQAT